MVADTVRGKSVADALVTLSFIPKRAGKPLEKLLASALANAKDLSLKTETMVVKEIAVNAGPTLKRSQPAARGSAHPIKKRTSHVSVTIAEK